MPRLLRRPTLRSAVARRAPSRLRRAAGRIAAGPARVAIRPGPFRTPAWLLLGAAASLVTLLVISAPAPLEPLPAATSTYVTAWSMADLQSHIAAGDVTSVTATRDRIVIDAGQAAGPVAALAGGATFGAGGSEPVLLARTAAGRQVPVALTVAYASAVDVLRQLGLERLLTQDALRARTDPAGFAATGAARAQPPAQLVSALSAGSFALLLVGLMLAIQRGARLPSLGSLSSRDRAKAGFQTILPARRPGVAAIGGEPAPGQGEATTPETPRALVRFDDVAGVDEAKLELAETVEFLKDPARFARLGARTPRGVLLYGPPGTGKTMLARAVAGEAGVPFTYASGSDFVEMFVGVGAARIRKLFAAARAHGAGVIFIDEIDAVAKRRSGPGANGNDEREGTLNALLVELDGFASSESLVVIAATNRLDTLDPALLRPGRFGRKVHVGLPDKDGRRAILAVHAGGKPLDASVDLEAVARRTAGFSGAQLADLLNEAAIAAARRGAQAITRDDVRAGWLKAAVGVSRRRSMNARERSIIAAHEAGHAICGRLWGEVRRVEEISLYQHGEALGVTVSSSDDNALPSERDLRAMLASLMGGRAAEALLFTEVTGGAANDFEQARGLAARMVRVWGLGHDPESGLGGHALVSAEGEQVTTTVRESQVRAELALLDRAAEDARSSLLAHLEALDRVSAYLFEQERIDGDEFAAVFEGRLLPEETALGAWRSAASSPRDWHEIDALAGELAVADAAPGAADAAGAADATAEAEAGATGAARAA